MSLAQEKSEAITPFLAPGESVESVFHESGEQWQHPNYYALTDRRLVELTERRTDDDETKIEFRSHPLGDATHVSVQRVEPDGSDTDDEMVAAGILSALCGVGAFVLFGSGEMGAFFNLAGVLFVVVGIVLVALGFDGSSGGTAKIRLRVGQPDRRVSIGLPVTGENFAQDVAAQIGRHQK